MMSKNSIVPFLKDYLIKFLTRPFLLDTNDKGLIPVVGRMLTIEASDIKKHVTFHCGRHSFASLLLENGVDIYTIKDLMGHTNVRTTQIYTHIVNEKKEKAANTLHIDNLNL